MPVVKLVTIIAAPQQRCFDLSRSIDLHKISIRHTNEEAIGGVTTGLIKLNQSVTWRAKHFGFYHQLTSKITEFDAPKYFVDEMKLGIFKKFRHEHHFEECDDSHTKMIDTFDYESPLGFLGKIVDSLFLKRYMTKLLVQRNAVIKEFAESNKWRQVLSDH